MNSAQLQTSKTDITVENPTITTEWGKSIVVTDLSSQTDYHNRSIHDLALESNANILIDPDDINRTKWYGQYQAVFEASYPLSDLLSRQLTVAADRHWLSWWEIYGDLIARMTLTLKLRLETLKQKQNRKVGLKGVPVRSLHINTIGSHQPLEKALNRVEFHSRAQIISETLIAAEPKLIKQIASNDRLVYPIIALSDDKLANLRLLSNKIQTVYRVVDIITIDYDLILAIGFVLTNLNPGGYAFVRVYNIANASSAAMIHLFQNSFKSVKFIHETNDGVYLCGEEFLGNLSAKQKRLLTEFYTNFESNQVPFAQEYLTTEPWISTMEQLTRINTSVQNWRYQFYDHLFSCVNHLRKSAGRNFDNYAAEYLAEQYPDLSDQWIQLTGFDYFTRPMSEKVEQTK